MKKLAFVAALALPMMVSAAESNLDSHIFALAGLKNSVTITSKGMCFGVVKFSGKGKLTQATPGFDSALNAVLGFPATAHPGDPFDWNSDFLLDHVDPSSGLPTPAPVNLQGVIVTRTNDKMTLNYPNPADQLKAATAVLAYAGSFSDQLKNAVLDPAAKAKNPPPAYSISAKFTKAGEQASVTETSYVKSVQGPCTSSAKIVRKFTGVHIGP